MPCEIAQVGMALNPPPAIMPDLGGGDFERGF
jgi:hypothetical protein